MMRRVCAIAARFGASVLVVTLGVGCSRTQPAKAPPPPAPDRCAHVADHLLSLLSPTAREAPPEELDRVRAQFNTRCTADKWTPAAQQCFLALTSKDEVNRCASLLTDEQQRALEQ